MNNQNNNQGYDKTAEFERRNKIAEQYPCHVEVNHMTIKRDGMLRGYCSLLVNGSLIIRGVRLMQSAKGNLFTSMPGYTLRVGPESQSKYKEHVFPVTPNLRRLIHEAVLDAYTQEMEQAQQEFCEQRHEDDGSAGTQE